MDIGIAFHLSPLVLHGFVLMLIGETTPFIRRSPSRPVRRYVRTFLILTTALSLLFIYAQTFWLLNIPTSLLSLCNIFWLVFDLLLGVTLLVFVGGVRVFLVWQQRTCPHACFRCLTHND